MQEKQLFEYAVIRFVPSVEREEFLNIGVIVFCQAQGFLQTKTLVDEKRISSFSAESDLLILREGLRSFERICAGRKEGGAIGQLSIASRFRWLTANRSTILQTSAVHPGLCLNPEETLHRLFNQLVTS